MNTNKLETVATVTLFSLVLLYGMFHVGRYYEAKQQPAKQISNEERIAVYNSGYRAGSMDRLAQLVECDKVTDKAVTRDYQIVSETLKRFGELDEAPYPCEE